MNRKKKKINKKLKKLGQTIGLDESDIARAKINMRSVLSVAIASSFIMLIGMFVITQLDAIGLYYTGVSIKDFSLFSRFF